MTIVIRSLTKGYRYDYGFPFLGISGSGSIITIVVIDHSAHKRVKTPPPVRRVREDNKRRRDDADEESARSESAHFH